MDYVEEKIKRADRYFKLSTAEQAEKDFMQRWASSSRRKEMYEAGIPVYSHSMNRKTRAVEDIIRKDIGNALISTNAYIRRYASLIVDNENKQWKTSKSIPLEEVCDTDKLKEKDDEEDEVSFSVFDY